MYMYAYIEYTLARMINIHINQSIKLFFVYSEKDYLSDTNANKVYHDSGVMKQNK